jgi:tRNA A-37 threonylcarbamoyl transferase component Bud32
MVSCMGREASGGGDASSATLGVPQAGDIVGGKFVVERVLGVGGMGVVVAAHHAHLEQTVAIKFLRRDSAKDEAAVNRFLREARAVTALQSEHVVRVMDAGRLDDGLPYLVMEYLSGSDLDQVLAQRGQLPLEEAVEYLLQAMEAVADAHAAGIVHRDLKPSNLFVTTRADGSPLVKVLDFGISKALDASGAKQVSLTSTSMTLGSPLYMSPEQVRSSKNVDARTDVWALGIIAYELLAGVQPFEAETVTGLCAKIVADEPPPLRLVRPDVPPAFEAIVLRCLEKNAAARYQSVAELAASLRPFASPEGRASVARIARTGGVRPTLASLQDGPIGGVRAATPAAQAAGSSERISAPGGRASGPGGRISGPDVRISTPGGAGSDPAVGYAETVASWQTTGDRRGRQVKAATVVSAAVVAIGLLALVAAKWPRNAAPAFVPIPVVSAANLAASPPTAVEVPLAPAPVEKPIAGPSMTAASSSTDANRPGPSTTVPTASAVRPASVPPRHPATPKAAVSPPVAKTTDDLLLDRK